MKILFPFLSILVVALSVLAQQEGPSTPIDSVEDVEKREDEAIDKASSEVQGERIKKTGIYWSAPDYSNQERALGYQKEFFHEPPPGLEDRVQFWIDIYSKYTTRQALLHDARYMNIVYKVLDFSKVGSDREKKKLVKDEKRKIKEQLERIQRLESTPNRLSSEDLAVYKKFRFVTEKYKFHAAARRGRLRMQLGQSDRFKLGIYYSGRYLKDMEKIFRDEGLPIELTRLPFVESSFNLYARSHVGASGIWQFMRSTGRLFKLKITPYSDPRNDPLTATRAAAKLLKVNYEMLGSWPLALTGYNHGPAGVARIKKHLKSDDINEIVWNSEARRFGFASENFFAEFLAALAVEEKAGKYFGKIDISPPMEFDEFELTKPTTYRRLAQVLQGDDERFRMYNPFLTPAVFKYNRPLPGSFKIRFPKDIKVAQILDQLPEPSPSGRVTVNGKTVFYKVQRGDTLSSISKDFGVPVRKILDANKLGRKSSLRVGQNISIPDGN